MSKFFTIRNVILILILFLAAFLRILSLGSVPPSASMDEASIGYNAYSVLKTGGDEYGEFPLISQRSYDDWRRSTYLLLVVPFINIFDLNVVSVRLPAVILSILTVWATYRIVLLLFLKRSPFATTNALIASLLLAISPWHIYISRLGHESNATLSFLVFGTMFFLESLKNKNKLLISVGFLILSMISYYSGQVFVPLFAAGLLLIFRKNIFSLALSSKKMLISLLFFIVLLIPIFWAIFSPYALIRFRGTSTFNPQAHKELFHKRVVLWNKAVVDKDLIGMIVYHRRLFPLVVFTEGYFSHFNPKWLFTNSSSEPFKIPQLGLLNLWEAPLIVIGLFVLIFTKMIDSKNKKLVFLWFLLAPIPASIATQAPHAMRFYNVLPVWQIFSALGFVYILYRFRKLNVFILPLLSFVILVSILFFYTNYFIVFPKTQSSSFHYALSQAIPFVLKRQELYDKIIFSNKENLYQSYMLFLFHSKYDPYLYKKQGGTASGGFDEEHRFGKYEFRQIDWEKDKLTSSTLIIGNITDFTDSAHALETLTNLNGEEAIKIVEIQ